MKRISWIFAVLLILAGISSAATVWKVESVDPQYWNDPVNWTNDVPGVNDGKAVFNVPNAAECLVNDAQTFAQLVQGDNNAGGIIRIQNGGSLTTTTGWSAIGYNNTAHMIVEEGGIVSFGEHIWVGLLAGSEGTLDINGGTVNVAAMIGLGWDGGTGYVNINDGGLLALSNIHGDGSSSIKSGLIDITGTGMLTLPGDFIGTIEKYVNAGTIVGNGIAGNVQAVFADDVTTVTAIPEPMTLALLGIGGLLIRKRR